MLGREKIAAVILAAGRSSRMEEFKPLMKLNGKTVIENSIQCFRDAGITRISVVTGHRSGELTSLLDGIGVEYVINENYDNGMFSSVKTGVASIIDDADGFFLLPGDIPLVRSSSIKQLADKFRSSDCSVIYPSFMGERGHPPVISRRCFDAIMNSGISSNLRAVLDGFEAESCDAELIDHTILMDMDTQGDFRRAVEQVMQGYFPSDDEIKAFYTMYRAPDKVIRHCEAVTGIALKIAEIINSKSSIKIDFDLVRTASLLHDIVRDMKNHAVEGAKVLSSHGFPEVGRIISGHMDLEFDGNSEPDESAIVYLADKFIIEDKFISIEDRFKESIEKNTGNEEALNNILRRKNTALRVKHRIEEITGTANLEKLLEEVRV